MVTTRQVLIVGVAGVLGWLATRKVRQQVPGTVGIAMGALAGMVVETSATRWLEQNV